MTRIAKLSPTKSAKPRRSAGRPKSGQLLIDAMQASPHRDIDIEPGRMSMPVRQLDDLMFDGHTGKSPD